MKLCKECGTKLGETDQFCTGCGARVYRGEDCESYVYDESVEEEMASTSIEGNRKALKKIKINKGKFKSYGSDILTFLIDTYTKPAAASIRYSKNPIREGSFILAGIMGIILGLISIWMTKRIAFGLNFGILPILKIEAENSYLKIFGTTLGSYILMMLSLAIGIFMSGQLLYNVRVKFLALWNLVTITGVLYTTAALLTLIMSYLFPALTIIFVVFITLIAIVSIYQGTKDLMKLSEDHAAFTISFAFVISMIILYLLTKI